MSQPPPSHRIAEDGPCRRRLEIQIPPAEVEGEIRRAARALAKDLRLPGFRRGKVPADLIRKRYAEQVESEAVERLAGRHVKPILEGEGLEPVGPPVLDKHEYQPGQPLNMVIRFEIEALFELADYRGLKVARPDPRVQDEEVDRALESIRQGMARLRTVENRGAREGDDVLLDLHGNHLEGSQAGESFERGEITLIIGTEDVHPDLSRTLVGTRAGEEREVTIRYPDDYRTPALAGCTIRYRMRVTAVRERQLLELGDDLAREVGEFGTLEELRKSIREDLERKKATWAKEKVREGLVRALLERNRFEVPGSLVEQEARRRLEGLAREMAASNVDPEQAGIDWKEEWELQARRAELDLRTSRILDAVAEKESIQVPEEDIERLIEKEAEQSKKKAAVIRARWLKEGRINALNRHLRRDRVLDFLAAVGHIHDESE